MPMTTPDWYLDELHHAGPEHLDTGYVPGYDYKSGTDPAEDLDILRDLGLNETSVLVDLGAGTGTFALAAAPLCRRVVAVDVSPVMLNVLREKAAEQHLGNIELVQNGFLSYDHQGEAADFVYSRHALHHLPDFWKAIALARIYAMLKPGGVLFVRDLIYSFEPREADQFIEAWLTDASDSPERGWTRAELATHLRDEYSPFSWLFEPMLEHAGFKIKSKTYDRLRVRAWYTCVKPL